MPARTPLSVCVVFNQDEIMHNIEHRVQAVQSRQQRQWLWQCVSAGLLAGGALGCGMSVIRILTGGAFSWVWIAAAVAIPTAAGAVIASVRSRSMLCAARLIDSECGLKDRAQTAVQFIASGENSALRRLQIEDTESHLKSVDPGKVAPIVAPRSWPWGVITGALAILLATVSGQPEQLLASVTPNAVVAEQATRASDALEELKQFQKDQNDPELERLLKQLNEQLQELETVAVDPKEALAKLSEMEAALEQMQKQLNDPSTEAQLQEIGDALSLSEALAAAGQAMMKGEMEKAAQELEKAALPELDRKTEKAITEKLDKAQKNSGDGSKKQDLKNALEKMGSGISEGNKSKFAEGAKGLASECKKQGQKKKLSDLLRKQCQCLSECKSECESECNNPSSTPKKGGKKAGTAAAGAEGAEKTAKLKSGEEMKLTGQDSGSGEVDIETTTNPEQEQEAVRQYRQNAEKYEALSESVLESESIPLGHRQTIRRYFEMIRPQGTEVDAVNEATAAEPK
jgi:hypothetical protein